MEGSLLTGAHRMMTCHHYKLSGNVLIVFRMMTVPERRYNSENVTISLLNGPETAANLNISNIQAFTIWCEPFELFFGSLILPANVSIPSVDVS